MFFSQVAEVHLQCILVKKPIFLNAFAGVSNGPQPSPVRSWVLLAGWAGFPSLSTSPTSWLHFPRFRSLAGGRWQVATRGPEAHNVPAACPDKTERPSFPRSFSSRWRTLSCLQLFLPLWADSLRQGREARSSGEPQWVRGPPPGWRVSCKSAFHGNTQLE